MPKQALTTQEFLKLHPFCCFCGGIVPATTRDHVPPRIAFHNKDWPEGFEFPACKQCNSSTRLLDQEFALLCAYGGFDQSVGQARFDHFKKVFTAIANNNLPLAVGLRMSSNEKRRTMREWGQTISRGSTYNELPILQLPPRAALAHEVLGFKLGCALHYMHYKRPLAETSRVANKINTNATFMSEGVAPVLLDNTVHAPHPMRGKKNLSEQFAYRYAPPNDLRVGVFVCKFGDSFHLNIVSIENPSAVTFDLGELSPVAGYLADVNFRATKLETLSTHTMFGGPWP